MLIFADEGGEGGVSGNADVIMSFCEKGKKNYFHFFCIRQRNIEKSEIN